MTLENTWCGIAARDEWEFALVVSHNDQHTVVVADESGCFNLAENMVYQEHAELIARTINAACATNIAKQIAELENQKQVLIGDMKRILAAESNIGKDAV